MFRFSIDRGGTFTDVYSECPDGSIRVMKLLSEDPDNYDDAPREAIRRIFEEVRGLIQFLFPYGLYTPLGSWVYYTTMINHACMSYVVYFFLLR